MSGGADPAYRPWRVQHFRPQTRVSAAKDVARDYLEDAFLYRRMPPTTFDGRPVDTTMRWFIGSTAAFLHSASRNGGTTGRRAEDDAADSMDGLLACLVTAGRFEVETNGRFLPLGPGDVFVLDTAKPHVMRDYPGHVAVVFIPRAAAVTHVDMARADDLAGAVLTDADLADLFAMQARYLVGALERIRPAAFDAALAATADVALAMMASETDQTQGGDSLVARAKNLIANSSADPELTPAKVADILEVSRTRLYAAFAGQGMTLGAYLRDRRLQMFLTLLRERPTESIQQLSADAGFDASHSDFTKMFRRIYGVPPSRVRQALLDERALEGTLRALPPPHDTPSK